MSGGANNSTAAQCLTDPSATLEKLQELLKAKDDTSRFVGLALLKSVLDTGQLAHDPVSLCKLWEAISPKFLDRLLRAQQNDKVSKTEAKDMMDLAVAVLHKFTTLLAEDSRKEKRLTGRTGPLVKALLCSPPETTKLILQTLLTVVSQPEGSFEILQLEDYSPLIEIANQYPLVLDIIDYTWMNTSNINTQVQALKDSIDKLIPALIVNFKDTDALTFLRFCSNFMPRIEPEALPHSPQWLRPLILMLRKLVMSKPTAAGRAAYTHLAAALLQAYPEKCPALLFKGEASSNPDSKPFSYLFINLLLIDLRSSFPSLLSQLNSSEYPPTSQRLAAAFDIVSSFIGFLVRSLDDETSSTGFSMPPDLLLKLRKDIAETISLTIEYLRDRWDASIAGASGLHPDAIAGTAKTSQGERFTLTWESMKDNVNADPLVLAGIRTLAIWIREDENANLRSESAGLMDMWLGLYKTSFRGAIDFRYPILLALEGIMTTEDGVESFLGQQGWAYASEDLQSILRSISDPKMLHTPDVLTEASRGLQIVRVLLAVLDNDTTFVPAEDWMSIIPTTAGIKTSAASSPPPSIIIELQIAMLQLSMALLNKSAGGITKRYITSHAALAGLSNRLKRLVGSMENVDEADEFMGLLEDVDLDLLNLR